MKARWNALSKAQKCLRGGQIFFSLFVILGALLQLSGVWPNAGLLTTPTLGFMLLLQGAADWQVNRVTSVFGFLASIAVFVMFGIGVFLK